jgi:hypothetical protein
MNGIRAAPLGLLLVVLDARSASGWRTREHRAIGTEAYTAACEQVAKEVDVEHAKDAALIARFDEACANLDVEAKIYGQATAVAGDYLGGPDEFTTNRGSFNAVSRLHYYNLARANAGHFHPAVTREWRRYHAEAIERALSAAKLQGVAQSAEFERAFYENAFADHFLGDAFASGHMGFNRPASPAGAAYSFHDIWNARGRMVENRKRERWFTYGDGRLDDPKNRESRVHVVRAATASVHSFLLTFVRGERSNEDDDLNAWRELPYLIQAPELRPALQAVFEGRTEDNPTLVPLLAMMRPARTEAMAEVWTFAAGSFDSPNAPVVGVLAGLDVAVPLVPLDTYFAVGSTLYEPNGGNSLLLEAAIKAPLALSRGGIFVHQVDAGFSWIVKDEFAAVLHLEYRLNAELGPYVLYLSAGPSMIFPHARFGWYGGLGIGYVFSAAGGGAF